MKRFNLFFVCYFRRLNIKDWLLSPPAPPPPPVPIFAKLFFNFCRVFASGSILVAVHPARVASWHTKQTRGTKERKAASIGTTTTIATANTTATTKQNTFIMSTVDPLEELLWPSRIDCLETLNKTETVFKPGTFCFLFQFFAHLFIDR